MVEKQVKRCGVSILAIFVIFAGISRGQLSFVADSLYNTLVLNSRKLL
jgi:hypothetical protein